MKIDITNLEKLNIFEKHPELAEDINKLKEGLPRYILFDLIKKLKNDVVKKQDYEAAANLRSYETDIFTDVFGESMSRGIVLGKSIFGVFDVSIREELEVYCKLKECNIDETEKDFKELGISSIALGLSAGKIMFYVKNGKLEYPEMLESGFKISDFLKAKEEENKSV